MSDETWADPDDSTPDTRVPLDDLVRQLDRRTNGQVPSPTVSEGLTELMAWMTDEGTTVASAPLRVVVADDNPVVRAGLKVLLSGREDVTVVAEAADGRQAYEATAQHHPDVVLLDVRMPGVDGISALPYLVRIAPVVMLTYSRESETVLEAMRRGASGYLVHGEFTVDGLVAAVRGIREGRAHFTATPTGALAQVRGDAHGQLVQSSLPAASSGNPPQGRSNAGWAGGGPAAPARSRFQLSTREAEIMDLIASGMNNQQIAATCFISEKTVKNHINRIFVKLHSASRSEAAAKWLGTASGSSQGMR